MLKEDAAVAQCDGIVPVLILILMEHAQREYWSLCIWNIPNKVLILILMEHAQRDH